MSSYPNYNSYRHPNNKNEQNSRRNRQLVQQPQQQPVPPPQGDMEANYSWNNQNANRSYSNSNDAYPRAQDPSSTFAHLPIALGSYSQQGTRSDENTQRSTGLNSLVYASSLHQNSGASQSNVGAQGSSNTNNQYQSASSYSYPSQSNSAANTQAPTSYNQQPQQASSATSRTSATSYTYQNPPANNDGIRQYHTQPAHMSQPERCPSPKVNQRQRNTANHKSPPVTHSSTNASWNAPSYSQAPHGYSSYPAHTSSVANPSHTVTSTETLPTVTQDYPQVSETRTTEQISPSKVQYINPTDLYTQQYFLAQERARAEEAEQIAAEEARKKEAEAQAQAQAEAVARAAEEASSTNAQATPTTAAKGKAAKSKAAKNTSKKRTSAKNKAVEKDAAPADPLDPEGDDDMALEMRMMLEKLRGMRTKDPSLFAKLWDDFKKPAPSAQTAATPEQPAAGPSQSTINPSPATRTPTKTPKGQGVSQEKEIDGLPDLGRFPAQRRKRGKKSDAAEVVAANTLLDASASPAQVNVNSMLNQQHQQSPAPVPVPAAKISAAKTQQKASDATPSSSKPKVTPAQEATWPAATQQKLAKAASEYLSKDAANQGKECSAESLMLLLRNNPTYPDLCAQLEARGFVLDRQAMARFLLAAVPALLGGNNGQEQKKAEANKSTPPAQASPSLPPTTTQPPHPLSLPPQAPQSAQPPQASQLAPPTQSTIPPLPVLPQELPTSDLDVVFYQPGAPAHNPRAPKNADPNSGTADQKGKKRPRRSDGAWISNTPVGPKAEMAKKRLFSEIVDMSQVSSDEEEMPSDYDDDDEDGFSNRPIPNMNLDVSQPPNFPDPGPDPMDIDTDSSHPVDQSLPNSRAEMPEPDIDFDPDDEFVLREIKRIPNITKPLDPSAALKRVYYNPKSIARDIMLATGRHPSERPLNFHLMKFTQTFLGVTIRSDFETFKWDLVDPGGPSMPVVELEDILVEPPQLTRMKRRRRDDGSRDDPHVKRPTSDSQPQPSQTIATPGEPLSTSVSTPHGARDSMAGTPTTGQRTGRRGRPPGAKNKNPTKATLKALAKTTAGTSTRNAQPAVPAPATSVPEPSYPMFTCEWASCPAQLHDVHTLERHVVKNHIDGQQKCLWQDCPNFATEYSDEGLKEHLAKAHIQPLAWKYGDGPSVNGTVNFDPDRYLTANGLVVTPDATTAGESDTLIFPVEPTSIRAFNKLYGDQKPTDRAQQVLRAIQKRRKRIGIGLEQEGCEFSTPVRNKLFENDEDFHEVVTDEEEGTDDWFLQGEP